MGNRRRFEDAIFKVYPPKKLSSGERDLANMLILGTQARQVEDLETLIEFAGKLEEIGLVVSRVRKVRYSEDFEVECYPSDSNVRESDPNLTYKIYVKHRTLSGVVDNLVTVNVDRTFQGKNPYYRAFAGHPTSSRPSALASVS